MVTQMYETQLPLMGEKEKIKQVLINVISVMGEHFRMGQLIDDFIKRADEQNLFIKEEDTIYSKIKLDNKGTLLINKLIWELIWEKELIINLINNDYMFDSRQFNLIKNK